MIESIHLASSLLGIVAGIAVLYVSYRLLMFRNEFMKELEIKFVAKEVWHASELNHESTHRDIGRTMDRIWHKVFGE